MARSFHVMAMMLGLLILGVAGCADRLTDSSPGDAPSTQESNMNTETATFAMGCFWGSESTFKRLPGVASVRVGYTGGKTANPTYEQVCTGSTGHAESVEVKFDPSKTSYQQMLTVFFENHDPTTPNQQGPDFGPQYRSVIFYHTPEQKKLAEAEEAKRDDSGDYVSPIVTQIVPAGTFYPAEEYHQDYFDKMGVNWVCHLGNGKKAGVAH